MDTNLAIFNEIKNNFHVFYYEINNLIDKCREYNNFNRKFIFDMTTALQTINDSLVLTKKIHKSNKINYEFNIIIEKLLNTLKNKDDVYCSDILIYEIKPEVELWREIFN